MRCFKLLGNRIGLLGGSFNPAHKGHLYISQQALKRLGLNGVWWVVSPQNPLKSKSEMNSFQSRIETATALASSEPRILTTGIEKNLRTAYTADTLDALTGAYPKIQFIWLMGADNLLQIPKWDRWTSIFLTMPIAVFTRQSYSLRALRGTAAKIFAKNQISIRKIQHLVTMQPPVWAFLVIPENLTSATKIRLNSQRNNV